MMPSDDYIRSLELKLIISTKLLSLFHSDTTIGNSRLKDERNPNVVLINKINLQHTNKGNKFNFATIRKSLSTAQVPRNRVVKSTNLRQNSPLYNVPL